MLTAKLLKRAVKRLGKTVIQELGQELLAFLQETFPANEFKLQVSDWGAQKGDADILVKYGWQFINIASFGKIKGAVIMGLMNKEKHFQGLKCTPEEVAMFLEIQEAIGDFIVTKGFQQKSVNGDDFHTWYKQPEASQS
jgi:hypothetical protein